MPTVNKKVNINIVVIGQTGSGKSTTAAHFISNPGGIDSEEHASEKLEKQAAEIKKSSFKYGRVLDKLKAKREHGNTIDIALSKFETTKYLVTVSDVSGHRDFIENMISGISQADCAILMVDSTAGGFEAGISKDGQTREHALLAFTLGVKKMICCCNKMDATTPKHSEERYNEIVQSVSSYLRKVGYNPGIIPFIPISGLEGDNLIDRSTNLEWYKGPTLLEALDQIQEPNRHSDKPLRLSLEDHDEIGRNGTVAVGRIETGILKPGMKVTIGPTGLTAKVKSVGRMNHESVQEAVPGDIVGIHVKKRKIDLKRGYVASNSNDNPAKQAIRFTSRLVILNRPGGCLIPNGYTAVLHCHTFQGDVNFEKIMSKSNLIKSGKCDDEDDQELTDQVEPKSLEKGDVAIVKMVPSEPMVVEAFKEYPPLGHFTITDHMEQIVGVGVITSVERKEYGANKGIMSAFIKRGKCIGAAQVVLLVEALIGSAVNQVTDCFGKNDSNGGDANKHNEGQNPNTEGDANEDNKYT